MIENIPHIRPLRQVGIDECGLEIAMSHELFDSYHVDPAPDEPRGERVPQAVSRKTGVDSMEHPFDGLRDSVAMQCVVTAEDEPTRGFGREQRPDFLHGPWIRVTTRCGNPDRPCLVILHP